MLNPQSKIHNNVMLNLVQHLWLAVLFVASLLVFAHPISAQTIDYQIGQVEREIGRNAVSVDGTDFYTQVVAVNVGGEIKEINVGSEFQPLNINQLLGTGDKVLVTKALDGEFAMVDENTNSNFVISDIWRLDFIAYLTAGFVILVIVVAGMRGLLSLIGMVVSSAILIAFMIPQILSGADPVIVSLFGSIGIALVTVYLSHGWSLKSHLGLASIVATLLLVTILSYISVKSAHLMGLGSEEAFFLQYGNTAKINLQGLLLGGIIIGALGVLDDVVISQLSVVKQLIKAKSDISFNDLYYSSLSVGKDHVASLVNTLVLAYAGANLPLFLLFYLSPDIPFHITFNNELIAEEVVRTLVGSIGLVMAVPLTTLIGAFYMRERKR